MMKVRPTIIKEDKHQMQIKTILNHVQKFKSFGYGEARLLCSTVPPSLEVDVHERRNSWARCSVCELPASSYDRQPRRRFEFIPLWGIKVFLLYLLKRPENLTDKQEIKLAELVQYNLRSIKTDYEKILRIPYLQRHRNSIVSRYGRPSWA
jgi:hypothetical protein